MSNQGHSMSKNTQRGNGKEVNMLQLGHVKSMRVNIFKKKKKTLKGKIELIKKRYTRKPLWKWKDKFWV